MMKITVMNCLTKLCIQKFKNKHTFLKTRGEKNQIFPAQVVLNYPDINPLESSGTFTPMLLAAQFGCLNVTMYYIEAIEGG